MKRLVASLLSLAAISLCRPAFAQSPIMKPEPLPPLTMGSVRIEIPRLPGYVPATDSSVVAILQNLHAGSKTTRFQMPSADYEQQIKREEKPFTFAAVMESDRLAPIEISPEIFAVVKQRFRETVAQGGLEPARETNFDGTPRVVSPGAVVAEGDDFITFVTTRTGNKLRARTGVQIADNIELLSICRIKKHIVMLCLYVLYEQGAKTAAVTSTEQAAQKMSAWVEGIFRANH